MFVACKLPRTAEKSASCRSHVDFFILFPDFMYISGIITWCIAYARTRVNRVDRDPRRVCGPGTFSQHRVNSLGLSRLAESVPRRDVGRS